MTRTTSTTPLARALLVGAVAGVVASLVMALYAMLAAYAKDTGFFTPLYHIASLLADDANMMRSMSAAQADGDSFTFLFGPAVLGALIHMTTGAAYGAVFGLLASRLPLSLHGLAGLAGVGAVYGFVVFAVSAFVGLPLAAAVFGAGDPIADMAQMAGWGTFIVEHVLFGLVLGILTAKWLSSRTGRTIQAGSASR